MNISPAVQARMNELREKEAAAKAEAEQQKIRVEFMETQRIEDVRRTVEKESIEWEAELLFEAEKRQTWIRLLIEKGPNADPDPPPPRHPKYHIHQNTFSDYFKQVLCGTTEESIPKSYTVDNERSRHRIRILKHIIQTLRDALAEEARVAAEEKAIAAAAAAKAREARQKIAIELAAEDFQKTIAKTINTPWHSFTGVDGIDSSGTAVYVVYDKASKILRFEARIFAFTDPGVTIGYKDFSPPAFKAPTSWNGLFEKGQLPFLTCCPVCSEQIMLRCRRVDEWGHYASDIASIGCVENHYRWDPVTNQNWRSGWPGQWNPRDPDGSIAARIKLEKIITEKEIELQQLKVQLAALKKT